MVKLKNVASGIPFCLKAIPYPKASQVWVKVDYDRSCRKYLVVNYDDVSRCKFLSGDTLVAVDEITF